MEGRSRLPEGTPRTVQPAEDVFVREVGGELVLMNPTKGEYFGLAETGLAMWESLTRHGAVEAARAELLERYDVDAARLEADLDRFVDELVEAGLLAPAAG